MSGRRNERILAFVLVLLLGLIAVAVIVYKADSLGWSPGTG